MGIPGYDPYAQAGQARFDHAAALHAIEFVETLCTHVKGDWKGQRLALHPAHKAIVANLFGWKRPDGTRRFREAFVYLPRKNAKSLFAAALALFLLIGDGEPGSDVVCCAAKREQARHVWDMCRQMIKQEPVLDEACRCYQHSITVPATNGSLMPISADARTEHGANLHGAVLDEVHAMKDRELYDAVRTAMRVRRQPLVISITTADYAGESLCNTLLAHARRVRDNAIQDPTFLPVIYETARDEDWEKPEVWRKANPLLGTAFTEEDMRLEYERAKIEPAAQFAFRRLFLNQQTDTRVQAIDSRRWEACVGVRTDRYLYVAGHRVFVAEGQWRGTACWCGVDLAQRRDIAAAVFWFPERRVVLPLMWVPEAAVHQREKTDGVPYALWVKEGALKATEGDSIDYATVEADILAACEELGVHDVGIDRYDATMMTQRLIAAGLDVVPYSQTIAGLSAPTKEIVDRLVPGGLLQHGGHPVLAWMASNMVLAMDGNANVKPMKNRSTDKIDGMVAMAMAIGRQMASDPAETADWYGEHDIKEI